MRFSVSWAEACLDETFAEASGIELAYFTIHFKRYLEVLKTIIRYVPCGSHVLEVSSLHGHISKSLKKMGYEVSATDIASEIKKEFCSFEAVGIELCSCDLNNEKLPFGDSVFDCVILTEVIEHVHIGSVRPTLLEAERVLKHKGILILSTPNATNLGNRLRALLGKEPLSHELHIKEYSLKEVLAFFKDSNFIVCQVWFSMGLDYVHNVNSWWMKILKYLLYSFWAVYPRFRSTIFIVGEKDAG